MSTEHHHIYTNDEAASKSIRNRIIFYGLLFFAIAMFVACLNLVERNMQIAAAISICIALLSLLATVVFGMHCQDFSELSVEELKELSEALSDMPDLRTIFSEAISAGKKLRKRDLEFIRARHAQVKKDNMLKSIQDLQ